MNRRNFIASALAAVATIPVLGKLVQAQQESVDIACGPVDEVKAVWIDNKQVYPPKHYAALIEHTEDGLKEVSAKGYHRVPIHEIGEPLQFPIAEEDWGYVTHIAFSETPTGPVSRLFDLHTWSRRTIRAGQTTNLDFIVEYHY